MFLEVHCRVYDPENRKLDIRELSPWLWCGNDWDEKAFTLKVVYPACTKCFVEPALATLKLKLMNSDDNEIIEPRINAPNDRPFDLMILLQMNSGRLADIEKEKNNASSNRKTSESS